MKKILLVLLCLCVPLTTNAFTVDASEKFVIFTETSFKAVCTADRTDCKCFIRAVDGWKEFECPKQTTKKE